MSKCKYNNGFTMIEILIVLVLLAIIALIAIPKFSSIKLDANIQLSSQNIGTIQRIVRYYATLNDLEIGDPLIYTDVLGDTDTHLLGEPNSPLPQGGYSYLEVVPEIGTCYASETDPTYGEQVNTIVSNNNFCK